MDVFEFLERAGKDLGIAEESTGRAKIRSGEILSGSFLLQSSMKNKYVCLFSTDNIPHPPPPRKKKLNNGNLSSTRRVPIRLRLPEAKSWFKWRPSIPFQTALKGREFRVWLQFYCQIPRFPYGAMCPRPRRKSSVDNFWDYLLHCEYGTQRIWRHDISAKLHASDLSLAARHPIVEYRTYGHHWVNPDIKALGTNGGAYFYEVSFVKLPAPSYIGQLRQNPRAALNRAIYEKSARFREFISTSNNCRLFPILVRAFGGWHADAHNHVMEFGGIPFSYAVCNLSANVIPASWRAGRVKQCIVSACLHWFFSVGSTTSHDKEHKRLGIGESLPPALS